MSAATVVELVGVVKSFDAPGGPVHVLVGVDLAVGEGQIVAVAGRSGSGKTTLLTIVGGWERPEAGTVALLGGAVDAFDLPWKDLAILPQSLGLLDELTVEENVGLPLRLHGPNGSNGAAARAADPDELLERLGLAHLAQRSPREVSLGEQQRTAFARAAVLRPRVVLADEPVAHQNREWAEAMMQELRALADLGSTCLVASHNDVVLDVADQALELAEGRLQPRAS